MKQVSGVDQLRAGDGYIHIHGHRGARGILPENTLDSFKFSFDIGVRIVELDLLVTADGVAVITHNPVLMPYSTRDAEGKWLENEGLLIAQLSWQELQAFDVGGLKPDSEYAARFSDQAFRYGEKIPKFADLCALVSQREYRDVWLNVEIKSMPGHAEYTPPLPEFVKNILQPIFDYQLEQRVILQSFDWRVVHECAVQAETIPRSYLTYAPKPGDDEGVNIYQGSAWMDGLSLAEFDDSVPALIAADGGQIWSPFHHDLNASDAAVAKSKGLIINVWTVNEPADIDCMIELGVDGIITDYPGRVQQHLLARGMGWTADNIP